MRRDSGDFGAFSAAAVPPHTSDLLEGDLLGSFEDLGESSELKSHPSIEPSKRDPSFGIEDAGKRKNLAPLPSLGQPPATPMLRMTLPPRPSEISPDYIPPRRPLRRPSQPFDLLGPGSPPLVSIAGNDIVFHPASEVDDAPHPGLARSPTQSKLLHALTSTAKVAHKWKGVLEHVTPPQEVLMPTTAGHHEDHISQPIEVNHTTPFATPEQLAGVYVAPAGAPGFSNAGNHITRPNEQAMPESSRLRLVGRRLGTTEILTGHLASKVSLFRNRSKLTSQLWSDLPSRHKLSRTWSLLCEWALEPHQNNSTFEVSLDQHGASLATMYRLIAKWAVNHRGVGNILIARDGNGQDFGVFLNEAIVKKEGSYFGGGES